MPQIETTSSGGVASNANYGNPAAHASAHEPTLSQEDNGTADVKIVNNHGGALSTPDLLLTIYQQQMI